MSNGLALRKRSEAILVIAGQNLIYAAANLRVNRAFCNDDSHVSLNNRENNRKRRLQLAPCSPSDSSVSECYADKAVQYGWFGGAISSPRLTAVFFDSNSSSCPVTSVIPIPGRHTELRRFLLHIGPMDLTQ